MKTRAAVAWEAKRPLEIEEVDLQGPKAGEVMVQIKATGVYDPETRSAIEKFERDRRLPVTGQLSDRLVRELAAMTGRPLE